MDRPRQERLTEAYEILWNECRLEAYLHRYPHVASDSEGVADELIGAGDEEIETLTDTNSASSTSGKDGSPSPSSSKTADIVGKSSADDWLADWTEAELALFFPSLARRSRLFPDLISQDLGFSKSTTQIHYLLSCLRRQSELSKKKSRPIEAQSQSQDAIVPSKTERRSRRIAQMPEACEVSQEWINIEENLASRLQKWQDIEDAECGVEKPVDQVGPSVEAECNDNGNKNKNTEKEDDEIVSWDTQVINALLFLRHCPDCSPNLNTDNFIYNTPLSAWSGESELQLYAFSASLAVDVFADKGISKGKFSLAYKKYSRVHPTPRTHLHEESKGKTIAWRILLRGVELGLLAWVYLGGAVNGALPEGSLPKTMNQRLKSTQRKGSRFDQAQRHHLVWLDTLSGDERSGVALELLQKARESATQRLFNSLNWDEAIAISQSLSHIRLGDSHLELSPGEGQHQSASPVEKELAAPVESSSFEHVDLSSYPYAERNKIRARFRARVARYGKEAALAMPFEAQKIGRKRKDEEQEGVSARKKSRLEDIRREESIASTVEEVEGDADDEAGGDDAEEMPNSSESRKQVQISPSLLPRFKQIGVLPEIVMSKLPETSKTSLELFNLKALKHINRLLGKYGPDIDKSHTEGLSADSLRLLTELLYNHLEQILSCIMDTVSSGLNAKGEPHKLISAADIKAAILLSHSDNSIFREDDPSELASPMALDLFRSDPPQFYQCDDSKKEELRLQLHGLKALRSASQSNVDRHNSTIADAVISASDAFTTPLLLTYAPHTKVSPTNEPVMDFFSSSEESSIYNDSEEEREIQTQKERSRGLPEDSRRIDGRKRDYNERREEVEGQMWEQINQRDEKRAVVYESKLWASIGMKYKRARNLLVSNQASSEGIEGSNEEDASDNEDYEESQEASHDEEEEEEEEEEMEGDKNDDSEDNE